MVSGVQPQTPLAPHTVGAVQFPQDATVRAWPQLSLPDAPAQFLPMRLQNAAFVSGVQPQAFAVPPPPHVCGGVQGPHEPTVRDWPQLSVAV